MVFNLIKSFKNLLTNDSSIREPQEMLKSIEFHLVEHCNLNCQYCDHFSPIAEKNFLDIETFEKDIKQLSKVLNGNLKQLFLLGGEPLLHPQLIDFLPICRKYFPKTQISIFTNGILLEEQPEIFWKTCSQYDIEINVTKYPINLNFENIKRIAFSHVVKIQFFFTKELKTSWHAPLDLKGMQDKNENFAHCRYANYCVFLKAGRLYTCSIAPNIGHFNKYFGKNLPLTNKDSINIYKAKNEKEILEFLAKPIPFCKYCNVNARTFDHKWGVSKKEISEWTLPDEN